MNKEQFHGLLCEAVNDTDLRPSELPGLDLYIDQIITLMEEKLAANKRYPTDKLLTKTMINNYSKEGLIKPIKGKKYSKEHITEMLLIYSLKGTLTIQEIKALFNWAYAEPGLSAEETTEMLNEFCDAKKYQRSLLPEQVQCMLEETGCDVTTKQGLFKAILSMAAMSQYLKIMVEKIIDDQILDTENLVLPQ